MFRIHRTRIQEEKRKTLKLELQIRSSLYRLSIVLKTMDDELSLLPVSTSQCKIRMVFVDAINPRNLYATIARLS